MPIRATEKARYPKNWKDIRARILLRARYRCEECSVPNGAWIYRDKFGKWRYAGFRALRDAGHENPPFKVACHDDNWAVFTIKVIKVVLTIAHLDHTPENCADENLKALCQYHHLEYDRAHHRITAARTRHERNGNLELPL